MTSLRMLSLRQFRVRLSQNVVFQRIPAENCPRARVQYASDFSSSLTMVELGMGLMPTSFDIWIRRENDPVFQRYRQYEVYC